LFAKILLLSNEFTPFRSPLYSLSTINQAICKKYFALGVDKQAFELYYHFVLKAQHGIQRRIQQKGSGVMAITLKAARVNAGFTQKEAAKRLGISRGTLASYEMYKTKPDIEKAKRIADLYGTAVDGIIFLPSDCA
jgi:DNA-binding XRE family transcriptional regulator